MQFQNSHRKTRVPGVAGERTSKGMKGTKDRTGRIGLMSGSSMGKGLNRTTDTAVEPREVEVELHTDSLGSCLPEGNGNLPVEHQGKQTNSRVDGWAKAYASETEEESGNGGIRKETMRKAENTPAYNFDHSWIHRSPDFGTSDGASMTATMAGHPIPAEATLNVTMIPRDVRLAVAFRARESRMLAVNGRTLPQAS